MGSGFDFLAQETFELSEKFKKGRDISGFDDLRKLSFERFEKTLLQSPSTTLDLRSGPGLLFWTTKSQGTYSIRGITSADIRESYDKFLSFDSEILERLRCDTPSDIELNVFPTYSIEEAKYIYLNILNKRILLQEDWATNIGDPGNHWWLTHYDDYLEIQFGNRGMYSKENVIRLGPLGEGRTLSKILNSQQIEISNWVNFDEFSSNYKSFILRPRDPKDPHYLKLKNLFMEGEIFEEQSISQNFIKASILFLGPENSGSTSKV